MMTMTKPSVVNWRILMATVACAALLFPTSARAAEERSRGLYVAVAGENAVALVDVTTKRITRFPVEGANEPHAVAISPDGTKMYVGNAADGKVVILDAATKQTLKVVDAAGSICGMVWSHDRATLYLTDMKNGDIHVFDPASLEITGRIPVAERLCGLDVAPDRRRAFTGNMVAGGQVVVLDWETKGVIEKIPVGKMPHHVMLSPDGKTLYASVGGEGVVAKIDLSTGKIVKRIRTGGDPHALLVAPDGRHGYVTVRGKPHAKDSSIFVVDLETDRIVEQIPGVGSRACDLIFAR
jgi:YVTN family beta-propeller protein